MWKTGYDGPNKAEGQKGDTVEIVAEEPLACLFSRKTLFAFILN